MNKVYVSNVILVRILTKRDIVNYYLQIVSRPIKMVNVFDVHWDMKRLKRSCVGYCQWVALQQIPMVHVQIVYKDG